MLRFALACLLALTVVAVPLRASAVSPPCDMASMHAAMAMDDDMAMAHPAVPENGNGGHLPKQSCVDFCAAASAAAAVLAVVPAAAPVAVGLMDLRPVLPPRLVSHEPDRFDPPPKAHA